MSKGFTIPRSFAAAEKRLTDIDGLVTATEWERAAIVATFVRKGAGNGRPKSGNHGEPTEVSSVAAFAKKRIAGLRNERTITKYLDAWVDHSGFEVPEPGDVIPVDELPEWESIITELPNYKSKQDDIKKNPAAVAAALEDPAFADKVIRQTAPTAKENVRDSFSKNPTPNPSGEVPEGGRGRKNGGKSLASDIVEDVMGDGNLEEAYKYLLRAKAANDKGQINWNLRTQIVMNKVTDLVADLMSKSDMSAYNAAQAAGKK
jgi:hypothetical protein